MISSRTLADLSRQTRMNKDKVKEQFHYFNIQSEIDSVFGNWAVSKDGDVVNYLYPYAIFSIHLFEKEWTQVLKDKCWYLPECEDFLKNALSRAKYLVRNE